MKICIVGGGAIGMLFGGYIHLAGYRPLFITRTFEQAELLQNKGSFVDLHNGEQLHFWPKAYAADDSLVEENLQDVDIIFVIVKQPNISTVLEWLKEHVLPTTPLVWLMNGLGHQEEISQQLVNPLFFGITASGATRVSSIHVSERGREVTKIGKLALKQEDVAKEVDTEVHTNTDKLRHLIEALSNLQIPITYVPDMTVDMWKKCVMNACINPLTALLQIRNGLLVEKENLNLLMRQLYHELIPLVETVHGERAQKILANGRLWQEIEGVCRITSENRSSMLQDIQHNQLTEIEAMTGYFLKKAREYRLALPSHRFVYHALKFLQNRGAE